jgi:hypothetical protein
MALALGLPALLAETAVAVQQLGQLDARDDHASAMPGAIASGNPLA